MQNKTISWHSETENNGINKSQKQCVCPDKMPETVCMSRQDARNGVYVQTRCQKSEVNLTTSIVSTMEYHNDIKYLNAAGRKMYCGKPQMYTANISQIKCSAATSFTTSICQLHKLSTERSDFMANTTENITVLWRLQYKDNNENNPMACVCVCVCIQACVYVRTDLVLAGAW